MKPVRTALIVFLFWTVVTGALYPLLMTGVGALFFPRAAQGSLVERDGRVVGSRLLAQELTGDAYFQPRPSAVGYNAAGSGASNQGHTSAQLAKDVARRAADWKTANGTTEVPPEMVTASGSGLDPEISPRAAELQVARVAAARGLDAAKTAALMALVKSREQGPQLGFLGEPRVNVLELNVALDAAFPRAAQITTAVPGRAAQRAAQISAAMPAPGAAQISAATRRGAFVAAEQNRPAPKVAP